MIPGQAAGSTPSQAEAGIARNSLTVGAATVLSRLMGFARDILIARALGAGPLADAFLVAFRLPNLFRRVLGEGGLNAPFVPLYLQVKAGRSPQDVDRFAGETLAWFGVALLLLAGLTEIMAPWLVLALAGGFRHEPDTLALAERCTRLALPFLGFTVFASLLAAILNAEKRFAIAAFAPLVLNAALIAVLLHGEWVHLDAGSMPMRLAMAVSAGGMAHLAILGLALRLGRPGWPRLRLTWSPDMARLMVLAVPSLIAASTAQLVLLVATQIASRQPGAVSWLYYAERVFQMPLGFVAVAMGVVLLPEIARREAMGDDAGRQGTVERALFLGLAIAIPAAAALWMIAEPIVSVLFERGMFAEVDRRSTAAALAGLAPGLPLSVVSVVLAQVFFARQMPWGPFVAGLAALAGAAAFGFALGFMPLSQAPATVAAYAASLAFLVQGLVMAGLLLRLGLWRPSFAFLLKLAGLLASSAAMACVLWPLSGILWPWLVGPDKGVKGMLVLSGLVLAGIAVFVAAALALRLVTFRDLARLRG